MAEDTAAATLSKGVLGTAVGFGLYLLITGLGFGGRGAGKGAGRGVPVPPRPRDPDRLTFVMEGPTTRGGPLAFRLREDPSARPYTLPDVVARVMAGAHADLTLVVRGSVLQGAVTQALDIFRAAGIVVYREETHGQACAGIAGVPAISRGTYGRRGGAP